MGELENLQPKGVSKLGGFEDPILGCCTASMGAS